MGKVYIRFPMKIKDEFTVRELHPNIVQVHLPRQKSRRWCVVDFESREKLEEAVAALRKIRINNKSLKISLHKKEKKNIKEQALDSAESLLKLLKKRNPCDPDVWGDSDEIDMDGDVEWITITNNVTTFQLPIDTSEDEEEDDTWEIDDENDPAYNPDDENYEEEEEMDDFIANQNDNEDVFTDYSDDEDDDIDYVTFEYSSPSEPDKQSEIRTSNQDDAD